MFGAHAIYVDDRIVFILRQKQDKTKRDDGIWVVATQEHMPWLREAFPMLRPIELFGVKDWINLPESDARFEETALTLCDMVAQKDVRIGKVPNRQAKARPTAKAKAKPKAKKKR
jgi:hypothetical protein